jgi:hypothetical protein
MRTRTLLISYAKRKAVHTLDGKAHEPHDPHLRDVTEMFTLAMQSGSRAHY